MSVGQILEKKYKLVFDDGKYVIYDKNHGNGMVTTIPMKKNKLFPLKLGAEGGNLAYVTIENKGWLWHLRYAYLNFTSLKLLTSHEMVYRMPKVEDHKLVCEWCALGKHSRKSFPKGEAWRTSYTLQFVHYDICVPMQTHILDKNSYFLTFIYDFSRMCWVFFLKHKDEAFVRFKELKNNVDN